MDTSELSGSLNIVFEKEMQDLNGGHRTFTINVSKEEYDIRYPHAETLVQLFLTIRNSQYLKSLFVDTLKESILNSEETLLLPYGTYLGISRLCFYTLVNIGYVNEAITSLKKRKKDCDGIYDLVLYLIPKNFFNDSQQKEILTKVRSERVYSEMADKLDSKIVESRYQLLTKGINKVNIEINQDKKAVFEKISLLGFDKSYNQFLDEIDVFINAETSTVVNAGMISTLRAFMANLQKDIANKIAQKEGETIPVIEGRKEMGNIRGYLKKKLDLSDNDDKFVDSFVDILHYEGGTHSCQKKSTSV
jgi:hypothetical protein